MRDLFVSHVMEMILSPLKNEGIFYAIQCVFTEEENLHLLYFSKANRNMTSHSIRRIETSSVPQ